MTDPILSFISINWIKPLYKKLTNIWETRDKEFDEIVDVFGDPRVLAWLHGPVPVCPPVHRFANADGLSW